MKRFALALLALAALLYALARSQEARHPAWGYVAAFAEAAMVGAIADWFAVVALFRHPLGLPIPHTAIIPANQQRIGRNLADFIVDHFLGTAQVVDKLRTLDPAARLADWLRAPANAARVGEQLTAVVRRLLAMFDDERVRHFVRGSVVKKLEQVDVSLLAGRLLEVLTEQRRHQALLDEVLRQLGDQLQDERMKEKLSELIAGELRYLRYLGLDTVAGNLATAKMLAGVGRLLAAMSEDEDHPLRLRFDEAMQRFVQRLKDDPALRLKGETIRAELLSHPTLMGYLEGLWGEVLQWLHDDLARDDSSIRRRLAAAAGSLGDQLAGDAPMRQWINDQLLRAAPVLLDRHREDVRRYIAARVEQWDTDDLVSELERNIGRDLQFVRVNGTLVGGLVGLLIHAATRWAGG